MKDFEDLAASRKPTAEQVLAGMVPGAADEVGKQGTLEITGGGTGVGAGESTGTSAISNKDLSKGVDFAQAVLADP